MSNHAPDPILSLAVSVLSLAVPILSLVVPVLSLAVPVMSLTAPLLCFVIVVVRQKNFIAALCSLSLTMVKTGAKLEIPGRSGADQDGCNDLTNMIFVSKDDKTI